MDLAEQIFGILLSAGALFGGGWWLSHKLTEAEIERLRAGSDEARRAAAAKDARIAELQQKIEEVEKPVLVAPAAPTVANDWQLWTQPLSASEAWEPYNSRAPKVVCVANLKGGVAKTTLAANFAAYLAKEHGKRVLLVDFDYQSSLSQMVLRAAGIAEESSRVEKLLDSTYSDADALHFALSVSAALPGSAIYTATYGFDTFESRLQYEWMRGATSDDIRFRLRRRIQSEAFKTETSNFDVVLVDTGPRWTTGSINALAAASHVLIPTVLDSLSADAAFRFLNRINTLKREINRGMKLLGVVGTLTKDSSLQEGERTILKNTLPEQLDRAGYDPKLILESRMPRRNKIGEQSSANIAYNVIPRERAMSRAIFEPLTKRLFDANA